MLKTVTAFNLRKKALLYEDQQTKRSDLDASLSVFRLSIPDNCPLWTSKIKAFLRKLNAVTVFSINKSVI